MSLSYHLDVDFLSWRRVVQQESSRKQNGHSLSEMPVSINRCDSESYNSSRGGTRTPDPVVNSHLLYHLSYSGIAPEISRSLPLNQPIPISDLTVILVQGTAL